jgi:hypothetical protein|tara:strand:+ start:420 stop:1235 length:816 start_codon:yes stop_codon:yes gene_type:complete
MAYIGNIPAEKYQTLQKQSFTTSATDTYTLSYSVTNPQDLALFINNVRQNPNDAYTVSGTTLTLSSAITSSDTMYAVFLGRAVETIAPATGSVTNDMLAGSIDQSKLAGSIPNSKLSTPPTFGTQLLHVRDEKSTGTAGGTNSVGDQTRVLNTVVTNEITSASLSSNQITLPSGTYYIQSVAFAYETDMHRLFLYNTSDSSVVILGTSGFSNDTSQVLSPSFVKGRFTISSSKTFEIRHYTEKVASNVGLGINTADSRTNVYTDVQIWKVA